MRNISRELETLLAQDGSRHLLNQLPAMKYSPDCVARWVTKYWTELEKVHANGEGADYQWESDLHAIFLDLDGAIEKLPEKERVALRWITDADLPRYRSISNPCDNVAFNMRMSNKELRQLLNSAYRHISEELEN